ncbi:MAG: hypothetical protein U0939_04600 [Pirellulales bacterium]
MPSILARWFAAAGLRAVIATVLPIMASTATTVTTTAFTGAAITGTLTSARVGAAERSGDESTAEKPLTAAEARKHVGEKVWVKATIKTTKDRLEKRGEIYLDTELDFRDPANLAIVVNRDGANRRTKFESWRTNRGWPLLDVRRRSPPCVYTG